MIGKDSWRSRPVAVRLRLSSTYLKTYSSIAGDEKLTVFISHSFKNKPEFENVADWLDQVGVPYWHPTEVKSGDSLREQLRTAVGSCTVCIFVATLRSEEHTSELQS